MVALLVKIQVRAKAKFGQEITLSFEMGVKLREIVENIKVIESGASFEKFMTEAKLQALLESD